MRKLILLATLTCALSACAGLLSTLPSVLSFVDKAEVVLNSIDFFEHQFFAGHPDAALQRDVELAVHTAREQLETDRATCEAINDPTPEQVEAAFADFYASYQDILRLTHAIGVVGVPLGRVAASRDGLVVPSVDALRAEVRQ